MCFSRPRNEKGKELTKGRPCEIRLDEPRLQPCRLDMQALPQIGPVCLCYSIPVVLSSKRCLLIHLCTSTPTESWEISALPAQLTEAQSRLEPMATLRESEGLQTLFVLVCSEIVIMGKYLTDATVELTTHTLSNRGQSQRDSSECSITSILFAQHCPLKFFSGASP